MRKLILPSVLCALAVLSNGASAQILKLTPMTSFGTNGDGSVRPGDVDFLNNGGQLQRGLAWNPVTGHVLVACRTNSASPTIERIMVLDGTYGTNLAQLDMGSLAAGGNPSFFINLIGVADDGAIYVANLSNTQVPADGRLYRWDNEGAPQTLPWYGDPANGIAPDVNRRWGDTLAVRGAGTNTQVLLASRGTNLVLLRPVDSSMAAFYATTITTTTTAGDLGYGLTFGNGNTFWGTSGASGGGPLFYLSFDPNAGTATTLQSWSYTNVSASLSPIAFVPGSNWLVGIDTRPGPDFLRIYSVTNPAFAPVNQDRANWIIPTNFNNNTFAGSVAVTTNNIIYALDADNGINAFTVGSVASNTLPPSITLQPASKTIVIGSNYTFTAYADGESPLSFWWQYKSTTNAAVTVDLQVGGTSTTITSAQISNSGSYTFIASNAYGLTTSSVATLTVVSAPQAFYEPFDYVAGSLLANQSPVAGKAWNPVTGAGGVITNLNLSYPGLPAPVGNAFAWGNATISERLPTGTNVAGALFFSFLLRIDSLAGTLTSDTIAGFGEATNSSDTVFDPKINLATNSPTTYQLGVYKGGGTTLGALATNIINAGDTVFVVGNYNFVPDALNDTVNMWINPNPSTFSAASPPAPSVGPIGTISGADMTQLSHFFFRSTQGNHRKIADELRVGYSWAEVTPQALPTLTVTPVGTNAVLAWPSFYGSDYILQGNSNVVGGTWTSVTNAVVVTGGNNTVTVPARGTARYFRLLK